MGELICFLIGNGFNCMVREILENEIEKMTANSYVILRNNIYKEEYIRKFLNELDYLIKLWDEPKRLYDELLNRLEELNINVNVEESIGILKCVVDYLHKIGAIDISSKNYLHETNERMIQRIIKTAKDRLIDFELNNGYRILGEAFDIYDGYWQWFGNALLSLFENNEIIAHFYTTNYDGILDVLLMRGRSQYLEDGFDISNMCRVQTNNGNIWNAYKFRGFLSPNYFFNTHLIAHLHGSYKFVLTTSGEIYKITKSEDGHPTGYYPIIIYNSPVLKENIIKQFKVLRYYFEIFKFSIRKCSKFVIWGNSLRTDPHIVEAICKNFDKEKPLYIIDKEPDPVIKQLQNGCKKHGYEEFKNIKTLKDLGFNSPPKTKQELLELFRKIITD